MIKKCGAFCFKIGDSFTTETTYTLNLNWVVTESSASMMFHICTQGWKNPKAHDLDGDGLSDAFEADYDLNPGKVDTDNDGIVDGAEDNDNDGLTNLEEYNFGSHPNVPSYLLEWHYFAGCAPSSTIRTQISAAFSNHGYELLWVGGTAVANNWGDNGGVSDDEFLSNDGPVDLYFNNGDLATGSSTHRFVLFTDNNEDGSLGTYYDSTVYTNGGPFIQISMKEVDNADAVGWTDDEKYFVNIMHEIGHSLHYTLGDIHGGYHDSSPTGNSVMFQGFPDNDGYDHDWYDPAGQTFVPDFSYDLT